MRERAERPERPERPEPVDPRLAALTRVAHLLVDALAGIGPAADTSLAIPDQRPGPCRMPPAPGANPDWLWLSPEGQRVIAVLDAEEFRSAKVIAKAASFISSIQDRPSGEFYWLLGDLTRRRILQREADGYRLNLPDAPPLEVEP